MKEHLQYVTITDPLGGIRDGVFVPMTYRAIIVNRQGFYELEQFARRHFKSQQQLHEFAQNLLAAPSGQWERFTWVYE